MNNKLSIAPNAKQMFKKKFYMIVMAIMRTMKAYFKEKVKMISVGHGEG